MKWLKLFFIVPIFLFFVSCKKENAPAPSLPTINDYFPLASGKFIIYQLDSLVYINFGQTETIRSYEVKYEVDSLITDNLGRPSWRIFRYIRNNPSESWLPDATFLATNTGNTMEYYENNLRYIKLIQPFRDNFSWKGNSFIDTYSPNSEVRYLDNWDYTYEDVGQPATVGTFNFTEAVTILQRDEIIGNPNEPLAYSEKNYSIEKYAKGIGLVYRKFHHYEYQPPVSSSSLGYYQGYGITLTMIAHN